VEIRRFRRQRWGAWLAIFAMLLLALAPTVSQVLGAHAPHHRHDQHAAAVSDHAGHAGHGAQEAADDDCAGDCWRKCGYCDFLAHTPALAQVAHAAIISPLRPAAPAAARRIEPRYARSFSRAQPRGPPVLV
jgi:hypothetical protein